MLIDFHCLYHDRISLQHVRLTRWIEADQAWRVVGNMTGKPTVVAWTDECLAISQAGETIVSPHNWVEVGLPGPEWVRFDLWPHEVSTLVQWLLPRQWQLLDVDAGELICDLLRSTKL